MKKKNLFSVMIFVLFASLSITADVLDDPYVPITFTSLITHNMGFSQNPVSGTIAPEDNGLKDNTIYFNTIYDNKFYSTGEFYLYLQVFTTSKVQVKVSQHDALNGGINYSNRGNNTSGNFTGSQNSGDGTIIDEANITDTSIPRIYNRQFVLDIPIIGVSSGNTYTGTLIATLMTL